MNRHERRAARAHLRLVPDRQPVMNVYCRPFEAPESFSVMPKDARRMYVSVLCIMAEKVKAARNLDTPVWRLAASFHTLIQQGIASLEFDGSDYKIVLAPDLDFNWIN